MDRTIQIIILAFLLDSLVGDPKNNFHPVCIIGIIISTGIKLYNELRVKSPIFSVCYGMILAVITVCLAYFITKGILDLSHEVNYWFGFIIEVILCYFIIAAKSLKSESMKVYKSIKDGDLNQSRINLSYIVGRETGHLTFPQIIKATVETVAENLSDGVIAPLIFVLIGGVPLGMAYKAVNTLDSMIGYKNETYQYLGKFSARMDDVANLIPARISALFMIIACMFTVGNVKRATYTYIRDRYKHKSPNSAHTESVCAGALGLCLGGDNYYTGVLVRKPTIGDHITDPVPEHIITINKIMYTSTFITIVMMVLIKILILKA